MVRYLLSNLSQTQWIIYWPARNESIKWLGVRVFHSWIKGEMVMNIRLDGLKHCAEIKELYERYVKVNEYLHSLVAMKIINDYRIMELFPQIKVEIKPYYTEYPKVEVVA